MQKPVVMNNKKNKLIALISPFLLLSTCASLASCYLFKTQKSVKAYKRSYTLNEIRVAEQNTFRKLNNVSYPNQAYPKSNELNDSEIEAYSLFSNKTYHALVDTSKDDNMSYATIGLYSLLNEMVGASSRDELKDQLNSLLGLNESYREAFYKKVMYANSFASENSSIQLKNAAFLNNSYLYNHDFVDYLSKLYCEAYQLSFKNDASKMVEWVNQAVNDDNFIDEDYLEISKDSELFLFSTLYFKNMWQNKYLKENNLEDDFYLSNGSTTKATFMKHSYMVEGYFDYEKYISVRDYYQSGASITYLVPKNIGDDIFELTKDVNIFVNKLENYIKDESEYSSWYTVNLTTPKFTLKTDLNFKPSLTSLGFGDIFNPNIDSFKNAFNDENLVNYNIYADKMKQRNEVEFNEDGTIVKSLSTAHFGKASSAAPGLGNTLDVELNQPFIYIIRDVNNTPIFVGHVDNPKG